MNKKISAILIVTLLLMTTMTAFADTGFSDVKDSNWATPYISKLVTKGAIKGYPYGTFKPNNTITVAEFVKTIVALIDGDKEPTGKHWASGYMVASDILGIVPDGMFTEADWNKPITREKMGVIMEKTAEVFYEEATVTDEIKLNATKQSIKDYEQICKYCKDYIVQAVIRGLITGYTDGSFNPQSTATRAEATTMIVRLIEPSYRVFKAEIKPVKEGTNFTDIVSDEVGLKVISYETDKYIVLENADKFFLKYLFSSDSFGRDKFYVEYKNYGNVYTLDKNKKLIDTDDPTKDPTVLGTQAFDGKLEDTAYFVFIDMHEDIAYVVPNKLIK